MIAMHSVIYPARYYYYLWRLNNTEVGGEIMDVHEKIESIAYEVIPEMTKTYKNFNATEKERHAAALGLIKADKNIAEKLFLESLETNNDSIKALAIFHLGLIASNKRFNQIVNLSDSPDERIRWAVVTYLGAFENAETLSKLEYIKNHDPSKKIRDAAMYRLQGMGINHSQ